MFTISEQQIDVFKGNALKNFEDEMVIHLKTYFPAYFTMIKENAVRETIRYAYLKAGKYGFITQRNVCLYLNNVIMLGSNFDLDPQYPWAKQILNETSLAPKLKIDKLSDKTLEVVSLIAGSNHNFLNRALLNLYKNADKIFENLINSDLKNPIQHLQVLFSQKCEVVGVVNLQEMVSLGIEIAKSHKINSESAKLLYVVFMFMMGSGFDKDPQFSWTKSFLNNSSISDQEKVKSIYQQVIENLKSFISKV